MFKKNITDEFAKIGLKLLKIEEVDNSIYYLKCKLGLELLLINISKLLLIYIISVIFGIVNGMFIFLIAFFGVRVYAKGAHARSNLGCTVISVLLIVGIPLLILNGLILSDCLLALVGAIGYLLIFLYAPSDTKGNPIQDLKIKKRMRRKAILIYGVIILSTFSQLNSEVKNLIIGGAFTASFLLIPKVHEILYKI